MGIQSFALGALVYAHAAVAFASPGIVPIFPIRNVTTPTPTAEPTDSSCKPQCLVQYPQLTAVQWIDVEQVIYTTKITVATYRHIIVTSANSTIMTRSTVLFGDVPKEYDLYSVTYDGAGTAVVNVPITNSDGVEFSQFTYPTPFIDYATEYHWQGVLSTHDKDLNRACETAAPKYANVPLPLHPEYPQPKEVGAGKTDPSGVAHVPLWAPVKAEPDALFFQVAFPSESAFSYCESTSIEAPLPTAYEAPMFVTETETVWTTAGTEGVVHIESSATGFEDPVSERTFTPNFPHQESTATGFGLPGLGTPLSAHVESSVPGFSEQPAAQQTEKPDSPFVTSPAPGNFPTPALPAPTPVFTLVPTVIDGRTTTVPAFLIPGTGAVPGPSATASIGQTVTFNGQTTILAPPPPIFTLVPTTINGVSTTVPAFIISGSTTATLGQIVTLNGQPTVLSAPPSVFTTILTTIDGVVTTIPVYVISGTETATLGQTVTLNGQPTVLAAPPAVFTMVATTVNGMSTTVPVYVISGSITATVGQTITINGTTTVVSFPSATSTDGFGQPIATSAGGNKVQATGTGVPGQGAGPPGSEVSWSAALVGFGAVVVLWL